MANWILFVLVAQAIWAFCSLIDKIVISKGYIKNPVVYIVLNGLMNIFLIFLLPFVGFEPLKFIDFLIALFYGIVFSAGIILYYKAVQYDEISKVIMLRALESIFVLTLAFLFLREFLTKNHFIGFIFLVSASVLVSYKKVKNSFMLSKAFYYMLISTFLIAFAYVSAKHIYSVTGFWSGFLWLRLTSFSALFVLVAPSIRNQFIQTFKNMKNKIRGLLCFKIVIDFSAFIFLGYAITNGPVSIVSALSSSLHPLFVFIFALLTSIYLPRIVKEDINRKTILTKFLALLLIISGIVFVNL